MVSACWGHGRVWGRGWETGAFQRAEQPCATSHQVCERDEGGTCTGVWALSRGPRRGLKFRSFLACRVLAVFENAKLPTSSLPTESGSGNCLGNSLLILAAKIWPQKKII